MLAALAENARNSAASRWLAQRDPRERLILGLLAATVAVSVFWLSKMEISQERIIYEI